MDIPGLGGFRCVAKGVRFVGPLFPKNIGLGFWVGFDISILAPICQKCNEKGLGRRGSGSFGYETVGSGMRWAGGQGQNSVMVISDFSGKVSSQGQLHI